MISRVSPSTSLTFGRTRLEVVEVLGIDLREARRAERAAEERERRGRGVAGVVPAGEGADQGRGAQAVGTVLPNQRLHPLHRTSWSDAARRSSPPYRATARSPRCAPATASTASSSCTRKERLAARTGAPYLALELRDRSGALPARLFRDADLQGGRFDARRAGARLGPRRALPRADPDRARRGSSARPTARSTRPSSCPSPTATSTSSTGSSSTWRARSPTPATGGCSTQLLADRRFRVEFCAAACTRAGHHAYLGGLLEHTVAVATLAQELALGHPRLDSDLLICAAIVHDIGKTREFTYGASIELSEEGRLLGHVQIGLRLLRERAARRARRAAPARARALRALPPRPRRRARRALRERRGARPAPAQRARRERQGRARARARAAVAPRALSVAGARARVPAAVPAVPPPVLRPQATAVGTRRVIAPPARRAGHRESSPARRGS